MTQENLKITLIVIVALVALILKFLKPKIKGKYGEAKISLLLKLLSSKKYKIINDVLIRNESRSSQIDHIVISNYGIYVIETKNYKGWIFGHEGSTYWTQTLYKKKYEFRNPVFQSWGHINTLKAILPEFSHIPFYPIIVFTGNAKLKKITSKVPVINSSKLIRYISNCDTTEYISNDEILQIYQKLVRLNKTDSASRKSHVKKAKTTQRSSLKSQTCPRCGGRLFIKEGKYGMFHGCSNFPRCKYTKDYKK